MSVAKPQPTSVGVLVGTSGSTSSVSGESLVYLTTMARAARAQVGELRGQLDELRRVIAELRGDEPQTGHAGAEPTRAPRHAQEEA